MLLSRFQLQIFLSTERLRGSLSTKMKGLRMPPIACGTLLASGWSTKVLHIIIRSLFSRLTGSLPVQNHYEQNVNIWNLDLEILISFIIVMDWKKQQISTHYLRWCVTWFILDVDYKVNNNSLVRIIFIKNPPTSICLWSHTQNTRK